MAVDLQHRNGICEHHGGVFNERGEGVLSIHRLQEQAAHESDSSWDDLSNRFINNKL